MEFKLNLITPTVYSQSGPNNCVDSLSEEFAEYVKHRADTEFNTPCKFTKVSGLAYIHSFEDFEERFLIHSEYAVIIASPYSQKAIKQFLPRLLVFLSSRSIWMNRFLFVVLGDVEVMDSLVVHSPIRFSINQWKTHDEESWTALFDLIKVKWMPYVEEVIERETITESPVSQSNDQHKTKKLVNVGTQGSLVFIDSYYYLSLDTLKSTPPSYKDEFSNTESHESKFVTELSKNIEGRLNDVNSVSKEISVYDLTTSKVTTEKTYKSESEIDSEPNEQFAFRTKVKDTDIINIKEKEDTIMNVKESKEKEFFKNVKEQINEENNIIIGDNLHVSAEAAIENESEISVDPSDPPTIVKKRDEINIMEIEDQNIKVEECGYSLGKEHRTEELQTKEIEDEKIEEEENYEDTLTLKNIQKMTNLDIFMEDNQTSELNKDDNETKFELNISKTQIYKKDNMSSEFGNDNNLMKDKTNVGLENINNDDVYQKDEINVLEETFERKSSENIFPMTVSNNENVERLNEERNLMGIYEGKSNERSIEVVNKEEVFEDIVPCINTKVMIVDDVTDDDYNNLLKKDQDNKDTFKSKSYLESLSDYDSQSAEVVLESQISNIVLTDIEIFDKIENMVQSFELKIDNDNNDMETQEKNKMIEDINENSDEKSKHFINKINKEKSNFKNETLQDDDNKKEYKVDSVHQSGYSDVFKEARKNIDHGKEDEKNETNKQLPSLTEKYIHEEYSNTEKDKLKLSEENMLSKEIKISESETNINSQKYQNVQNDNEKESDSFLKSNLNFNLVKTVMDTDIISNLTKEVKENQSNINLLDKPLINVKGNFLKEEISKDNKETNEQKDSHNRDLNEKTKGKSYFEVQIKNSYKIEEIDTNVLQKDPSINDSYEKESLRKNEKKESLINSEENFEASMNLIKNEITQANEKEKLCADINPIETSMMSESERNKNDISAYESDSKPEESAETSSSIQSNSTLNDNKKHFSTSSVWFDNVFKRAKLYSLHSLGSTENEVVSETNILHRGNEQFSNNTDKEFGSETWYFILCSRLRSIRSYITSIFPRHEEHFVDRDTKEPLHTESSTSIQCQIIKWIRHPVGVFGMYVVLSIISPYIVRIIRHISLYPWLIVGVLNTLLRNTVHYQQVIKPYTMDIIHENKNNPYYYINSLEKMKLGNGLYTLIPER